MNNEIVNDVIAKVDMNQFLKDAQNYTMPIESLEINWELKTQNGSECVVPVIKLKYRDYNE